MAWAKAWRRECGGYPGGGSRSRVCRWAFVLRRQEGPAASGRRNQILSGSTAGVYRKRKGSGPAG